MTKGERAGTLVVAAVVGGFVALIVTGIVDRLGRQGWFSNGANVIQWISGPGTLLAVAAGVAAYLNRTCAASWGCFRHGEHPVDGCLKKVCDHHHTTKNHEAVYERHGPAHRLSGRLDRGMSHGRTNP